MDVIVFVYAEIAAVNIFGNIVIKNILSKKLISWNCH